MKASIKIERAMKNGRVIDLNGMNLAGMDFSGVDLQSANFKNANLTGANFNGADLSYANFTGATLSGASFEGADLESVTGNDQELVTIEIGLVSAVVNSVTGLVQIGEHTHTVAEWMEFSASERESILGEFAAMEWDDCAPLIIEAVA